MTRNRLLETQKDVPIDLALIGRSATLFLPYARPIQWRWQIAHANMLLAWKLLTVSENTKFAKVNHYEGTTMELLVTTNQPIRHLNPSHPAECGQFNTANKSKMAEVKATSQQLSKHRINTVTKRVKKRKWLMSCYLVKL